MSTSEALEALTAAVKSNDPAQVAGVLQRYPDLTQTIDQPLPGLPFDAAPLHAAVWQRNREMIDVLLGAGADVNARTGWWAGGFGVLDGADLELVPFLVERGARVDAHAAARIGQRARLEALLALDPSLVHARGGDGQTPLHVAASVEIAACLLERGADIDARDIDHESTPAQYMVRDRPDVARYLIARGCQTDILLAAAVGDLELVRRHLQVDPGSIRTAVTEEYFPKRNSRAGGSIYIWTLGASKTPHSVAREFGHEDVVRLLMDRSPAELKLAQACQFGDEMTVRALLASQPDLARSLPAGDRRKIADAAREGNLGAVRLMLQAGWPVDARGQHNATSLHWAAFNGHAEMTREILGYQPPLENRDNEFEGTPLQWGIYGSVHGWRCNTGDYAGTVEALLRAGAKAPPLTDDLQASEAVRAALRRSAGPTS